ncbi:MAG: hybrid sensor histidine kinase/response regulator [Chloroflexi bacterium]|nr:hybrid sensor histidine kinase/response regulator [Chloroflexota bacterium]
MKEHINVLFVDDSEGDVLLIVRELNKAGYAVRHRRVESAELLSHALDEKWDVVLCDYVMPGFSGLEALKLVLDKRPGLPCIIVSGQIGEETAVSAMRAGASDYIMKDKLGRLAPAVNREIREAREREEKREIQAALRAREDDLRLQQEVGRAKDEFVGFVSHELRTPLTVIIGGLRTVLAFHKLVSEEEERQLIEGAVAEAEHLNEIVENLLYLARAQTNRLEVLRTTVDASEVISGALKQIRTVGTGHQFILDCPSPVRVSADPVKLGVILHNLLVNAVKYSSPGEVCVSLRCKDGMAVIAVSDRGVGISEEDQERLFQPFERVGVSRDTTKGIGLGLLVCRRLVEAQGGRIWAKSRIGEGSTFFFTLPLAE